MSRPLVETGGGHRLLLRDWGGGPPVLLLAGWGRDARIRGEVMMALSARGPMRREAGYRAATLHEAPGDPDRFLHEVRAAEGPPRSRLRPSAHITGRPRPDPIGSPT